MAQSHVEEAWDDCSTVRYEGMRKGEDLDPLWIPQRWYFRLRYSIVPNGPSIKGGHIYMILVPTLSTYVFLNIDLYDFNRLGKEKERMTPIGTAPCEISYPCPSGKNQRFKGFSFFDSSCPSSFNSRLTNNQLHVSTCLRAGSEGSKGLVSSHQTPHTGCIQSKYRGNTFIVSFASFNRPT